MKLKKVFKVAVYVIIIYASFLLLMGILGKRSANNDFAFILEEALAAGNFKLDVNAGSISPISNIARDDFAASLATCMQKTLETRRLKKENFLFYLDGRWAYYHFKCQRQEEIMLPLIFNTILNVKDELTVDRDNLQNLLNQLNAENLQVKINPISK